MTQEMELKCKPLVGAVLGEQVNQLAFSVKMLLAEDLTEAGRFHLDQIMQTLFVDAPTREEP